MTNLEKQQNIIKRNEYINNLQAFLSSSKNLVHETLQKLNWSERKTVFENEKKTLISCPLDPEHRLPRDSLNNHVKMCIWHKQGYTDESVPLPSPTPFPDGSIVIDKELQASVILQAASKNPMIQIADLLRLLAVVRCNRANVRERDVPQTSDQIFSDFTSDERRILYDYIVSRTKGTMPQLQEFSLPFQEGKEGQSGQMTKEQLMAAERDAKRRRIRHRSAKVHTKSKNYSEVMRAIIDNQMLAYEDWLRDQNEIKDPFPPDAAETKSIEMAEGKKEEMIWLDWDFGSNPHTRWKYILEKEKRRLEKKVNEKNGEKEHDNRHRRTEREESSSRKLHHRSVSHSDKYDSYRRKRREDEERHSEKKKHVPQKEQDRFDREKRHRNHSSKEENLGYSYSREKYERLKNYGYTNERTPKRTRTEYELDSKYLENFKESSKKRARHKEEEIDHLKTSSKYHKYECESSAFTRIKLENPSSDCEDQQNKMKKLRESIKYEKESEEESSNSDSDGKSIRSSFESHSKKSRRKKKSKKKHKHKHKKRKKSIVEKSPVKSKSYVTSEESSD